MPYLIDLNQWQPAPLEAIPNLIGGKGLGLWLLSQAHCPHPQTWIVPTTLFTAFVATLSSRDTSVDLQQTATAFIQKHLQPELNQLPDKLFAVRSSATMEDSACHSFAGMFESKLQIAKAGLPAAIAEVWLSGLGNRLRDYTALNNWPTMAVVLQPMINPRWSGVCFTKHPAPTHILEENNFLIEMVAGLGENLVQGTTTPLRLLGPPRTLIEGTDYPWLRELIETAQSLAIRASQPIDIEFAVDELGQLWFLQQRPITTTLTTDILDLQGYHKAYKRALCTLDVEFLIDGCSRYLAPYLEVSGDLSRWMLMVTNLQDGQQELWINKALDESLINQISMKICADPQYLPRLQRRYAHHHQRILNWQQTLWADTSLPLEERLQDFFEFIAPINAHYYAPMHIIESLSALVIEGMRKINPATAETDFFAITTAAITLNQIFELECSRLHREMTSALSEFPPQSQKLPKEWQERLAPLANDFGFLKCHQPYEPAYSQEEVYDQVRTVNPEVITPLEPAGTYQELLTKYDALSERIQQLVYWLNLRNQQMEYLYFVYNKAADLLTAVGQCLGLSLKETWNRDRNYLISALSKLQKEDYFDHSRLTIFHNREQVIVSDRFKPIYPTTKEGSRHLKGKTVYGKGLIKGKVKVAFTPQEVTNALKSGQDMIIVTGMTTPDFVPALKQQVRGLITDEGGILCHAAIIAREIQLPCLVGTGTATEILKDGMEIEMDLARGECYFTEAK